MGLLDNLGGAVREEVGDVVGRPNSDKDQPGVAFPRKFKQRHFDDGEFGGSMAADQYSRVATYTVPSGTRVAWGYGKASNEANQGYLYVELVDDAGNPVEGTLRLAQTSPTERRHMVVADYDTSELKGDRSDRTRQVPLPEQIDKPLVKADSKIVVEFEPDDGAETIDGDQCEISLPVTEYDLNR